MDIQAILEILKNGFAILAYFFNPQVRKKRDRKKDWEQFKDLEYLHRKALSKGNPTEAAMYAKKMKDLRAEYKFVNRSK